MIRGLYYNRNNKKYRKRQNRTTNNQGIWQGCSLSQTLFSVYIDDAIRQLEQEVNPKIRLTPTKNVSTQNLLQMTKYFYKKKLRPHTLSNPPL